MPDDTLLCPDCGYDLRGIASLRCPECGTLVDRAALARGAVPWVYRHRTGPTRAFIQTAWMATISPEKLWTAANVGIGPRSLIAADHFRWIVILLSAVTASFGMAAAVYWNRGPAFLFPQDSLHIEESGRTHPDGLAWDVQAAWSTGVSLPPVMPVAAAIFFWLGIEMAGRLAQLGSGDTVHSARRQAVLSYSSVPLVSIPSAIVALAVLVALHLDGAIYQTKQWFWVFVLTVSAFCVLAISVFRLLRSVTSHATAAGSASAVLRLILLPWLPILGWAVAAALALVGLPVLARLFTIAVESLR